MKAKTELLKRLRMHLGSRAGRRRKKALPPAQPAEGAYSRACRGLVNAVLAVLLGVQLTEEATGQIFVVNNSAGTIGKYTTSGAVINAALISGLSQPEGIAVDGNGYLYVADTDAGRVGKYTISGAVVNPSLISGLNGPWALALDGKGNLFVANYGGRRVGKYTTSGAVINAALISGLDFLTGLALNEEGDLYVGNYGTPTTWIGSIGKYETSGATANAALIPGLKWNCGLACHTNGHLFVAQNLPPGRIAEYTASGILVNAFNSGLGAPTAIALDGHGNLFVADDSTGVIGKYTTSGATVNAALIAGLQHPRGVAVGVMPYSARLVNGDQTAEVGSSVQFAARCAGTPPFTFQFLRNGAESASEVTTNSFLKLANIQLDHHGAYTVVVSNAFGTVTSAPALLNVIPVVERRTVSGVKLFAAAGSTLSVEHTDAVAPAPNWQPVGTVSLASASQWCFDLSTPLPPQRFYRAWQSGQPGILPSLTPPNPA